MTCEEPVRSCATRTAESLSRFNSCWGTPILNERNCLFSPGDIFSSATIPIKKAMATDSKEKWNPLTRERFDEIPAEEMASLLPDALNIYEEHATRRRGTTLLR